MFNEGLLKKSKHAEINFELQITALIDTLVIILIFLLKSISVDTLEMEQSKNLSIPSVNQGVSTGKGARLSIGTDGISWNSAKLIPLDNFKASDSASARGGQHWGELAAAIASTAKQEKDADTFNGALFLEADKHTPFSLMNQALHLAKQQGYKDIRFVGARYN